MSVELELTLSNDRLFAGEDATFRWTIRNRSNATVLVRDPARDHRWPKLEVLDLTGWRVGGGARHDLDPPHVPDALPIERITLEPGAEASSTERLSRWIEPLPPGTYQLRARVEADGLLLVSARRELIIEPLEIVHSSFVGTDASHGPLRLGVVSARDRDGSTALLHWMGNASRPSRDWSERIASIDADANAEASISAAGYRYLSQWNLWITKSRLRGLFLDQGTPERAIDDAIDPSAVLISPVLTDLEECDGSAPPAAEVLLAERGDIVVIRIEPDGSLVTGPRWPMATSTLWSSATFRSDDIREAYVLGADGQLSRLCWGRGGAEQMERIAIGAGAVLGGALSCGSGDVIRGALLMRDESAYCVVGFSASPSRALETSRTEAEVPRGVALLRALVDVNEDGYYIAAESTGGWYGGTRSLAPLRLEHRPLSLYLDRAKPRLVLATDRGIAFSR